MEKKNKKIDRKSAARLDIRIDPKLKDALEKYCSENYETMSGVIKNAIKKYIDYKADK